ncbi:MAG: hypothetical protein QM644_14985 [Mobilitalea sp.]
MKIVFWSPVHGQTAMTSNFLMISLIAGILLKKKALITQTHFSFNNLEAPLVESNSKENSAYFLDIGIDALIRDFKSDKIVKKMIENCSIPIEDTNVTLLPGTIKTNRSSFDYEMDKVAPTLLKVIEEHYEVVFVDASPSANGLSMNLINDANLVVVNMSQNLGIIDLFNKEYKEKISTKIFYLFGFYDSNSKYNISNLRRRYKEIKFNNSGTIPYNTAFKDALIDSNVVSFVKKCISNPNKSEMYFIKKSISSAEKIIKLAENKQGAYK